MLTAKQQLLEIAKRHIKLSTNIFKDFFIINSSSLVQNLFLYNNTQKLQKSLDIWKNFDKLLSIRTEMPVYVTEDPLDCVVKGTGKTIDDLERLKSVLINSRRKR